MDPRLADILRHAVVVIILLVLALIGFKQYQRHAEKRRLVAEMRTDISDASFYRSLSAEEARRTFLRSIARIDRAARLGLEPPVFFDRVFDRKERNKIAISEDSGYPTREKLVRTSLQRAHQHARQLGLLDREEYLQDLEQGEIPPVEPKPVIGALIDPALSPGLEKVVPNFELRPAPKGPDYKPTDLEIAAARELIRDLADANLIEDAAAKRLLEHY